jgi:hypothetical protein
MARIDPEYASRAGANNAHFLLGRSGEDFSGYLSAALDSANEPNSVATYFFFPGAAMVLAARTDPDDSGPDAAGRARLILALEAFAEHFLEDMFAAGHVAGSWGNVAERKGTHDYYNRNGLEIRSWNGTETVIFGDAFLKPDGLALAARAVRESLAQVLDAATPGSGTWTAAREASSVEEAESGRYNVCVSRFAPHWDVPDPLRLDFETVARQLPVPFRGEGPGSLPRYHPEIGPFAGLVVRLVFEGRRYF